MRNAERTSFDVPAGTRPPPRHVHEQDDHATRARGPSARFVSGVHRGRLIVLNGPSSAGKTTLAGAVRTRIGPSIATVSIDQFFPCMHPDVRHSWQLFSTLTDALTWTVVALSNGGLDVIADTVFEREDCFTAMRDAFADRTLRLVAVTAPLHVLEAREHARGDRRAGQARAQHERVLHGLSYDLRLDTHDLTLDDCVDRVSALLPWAGRTAGRRSRRGDNRCGQGAFARRTVHRDRARKFT